MRWPHFQPSLAACSLYVVHKGYHLERKMFNIRAQSVLAFCLFKLPFMKHDRCTSNKKQSLAGKCTHSGGRLEPKLTVWLYVPFSCCICCRERGPVESVSCEWARATVAGSLMTVPPFLSLTLHLY